eukprot:361525-Chlamydomonas_euryale.AAC.2
MFPVCLHGWCRQRAGCLSPRKCTLGLCPNAMTPDARSTVWIPAGIKDNAWPEEKRLTDERRLQYTRLTRADHGVWPLQTLAPRRCACCHMRQQRFNLRAYFIQALRQPGADGRLISLLQQ